MEFARGMLLTIHNSSQKKVSNVINAPCGTILFVLVLLGTVNLPQKQNGTVMSAEIKTYCQTVFGSA